MNGLKTLDTIFSQTYNNPNVKPDDNYIIHFSKNMYYGDNFLKMIKNIKSKENLKKLRELITSWRDKGYLEEVFVKILNNYVIQILYQGIDPSLISNEMMDYTKVKTDLERLSRLNLMKMIQLFLNKYPIRNFYSKIMDDGKNINYEDKSNDNLEKVLDLEYYCIELKKKILKDLVQRKKLILALGKFVEEETAQKFKNY